MAWRTLAVTLACLLALGLVPGQAAAERRCEAAADRLRADPMPPPPLLPPPPMPYRLTEITVPIWVHVITDGRRGAPAAAVAGQMETLRDAYSGKFGGADTKIRFALQGVTRTANPAWFRDPLGHEKVMKSTLRRGGPDTLNLYIAQLSELVLGFSTYPHWYSGNPPVDGVVIDWRSLPGGPLRNFDRGFTGVHEIGHWLGLLHTFENGCAEPGDGVEDTPPQGRPTDGCPDSKDTCPQPGEDPIHNFMDYSHDRCMREFTEGQAARMHQMWAAYRIPKT
ncbi:zinc metalloprotease [Acrocarpospora catenulata]|uniref:zinc metalloprotease n=1 Tax=Acrocarpospora catenulata TaxID=2836182 RepID=UPI001BD98625|nr:zinc metalloprotease [Acrocarpospora catenulata]